MKSRQGMTTFCCMKRTSKHQIRCCFSGGDWSHRVLDLKNLCRKQWLLPWRFVAAQHVIYQSYILLTTWHHRQLSFWPNIPTVAWLHSVFLPNKREVIGLILRGHMFLLGLPQEGHPAYKKEKEKSAKSNMHGCSHVNKKAVKSSFCILCYS